MSEQHLKRTSTRLRCGTGDKRRKSPTMWYYEEPQGITVVSDHSLGLIPWRQIRAMLARLDRAERAQ
jgi:hypothetical protein